MLPDLPSELIRVALKDLRLCEADSRYTIFMGDWKIPGTDKHAKEVCYVCLAGAVMAQTLGSNIRTISSPRDFTDEVGFKLEALDDLRTGDVPMALTILGIAASSLVERVIIAEYYSENSEEFHNDMNALADDLEGMRL